jgi:hypothetical protein
MPAKSSELNLVSMARFTGIIDKSPRDQPVFIEAHQLWRCVVFPPSAQALLLGNSFRLLSSYYYGFDFIVGGNLKFGWVRFTTVRRAQIVLLDMLYKRSMGDTFLGSTYLLFKKAVS